MTWTLTMLSIAFGLSVCGFIGWRRERRREEAQTAEAAAAGKPDGDGAGRRVAMQEISADTRQIYAGAG